MLGKKKKEKRSWYLLLEVFSVLLQRPEWIPARKEGKMTTAPVDACAWRVKYEVNVWSDLQYVTTF